MEDVERKIIEAKENIKMKIQMATFSSNFNMETYIYIHNLSIYLYIYM